MAKNRNIDSIIESMSKLIIKLIIDDKVTGEFAKDLERLLIYVKDKEANTPPKGGWDRRHGGPYDRGSADRYYGRPCNPHYYVGGTDTSRKVEKSSMTVNEINAYEAGYREETNSKDY